MLFQLAHTAPNMSVSSCTRHITYKGIQQLTPFHGAERNQDEMWTRMWTQMWTRKGTEHRDIPDMPMRVCTVHVCKDDKSTNLPECQYYCPQMKKGGGGSAMFK